MSDYIIDILRFILFDGTITRTVLTMTITGSVLAILLFLLKRLFRERLPKAAQYYLWLAVVAALVVPVSLFISVTENNAVPVPAIPIQSIVSQTVITAEEEKNINLGSIPPNAAEWENSFHTSDKALMTSYLVFAYPCSVLIVLSYVIISYIVFMGLHRRRNHEASADETAMLAELCGSKRAPRLYRNPLAATPMLFGVFRPAIILPDREYTNEQLRAVLLHELTHLRHKDILVKWLSVIACAVHWFNPIVWLLRREIDRACELACDESVVRNLDEDGKQNYGETLLYVAADSKTPRAVLSTTMCEEKKALKERLGAILKSKKHTRVAILVSVVLILAVGGVAVALGAGRATNPNGLINKENLIADARASQAIVPSWNVSCAIGDKVAALIFYDNEQTSHTFSLYVKRGAGYQFTDGGMIGGIMDAVVAFVPRDTGETAIISMNKSDISRIEYSSLDMTLEVDQTKPFAVVVPAFPEDIQLFDANDNAILFYGIFDQRKNAITPESSNDYSDSVITLQQLRELAAKGDALEASDLPNPLPRGLSAIMGGYNPTLYGVEGGYRLLINFNDTMNPDSGIRSTALESIWENSGSGIDIRYGDVDEFIRTHPSHPAAVVTSTTFEPRKWVDFYGAEVPWTTTYDLMLDEFPRVMFSWTAEKVTAGTTTVIDGMPVWNVYLADLNGDNLPELCATVSSGSGIVDDRIIVYDYANGKRYQLAERMARDFRLSIENERLVVLAHDHMMRNSIEPPTVGSIAIVNGELVYTVERIITQNENSQIGAPTPAVRVRMDDRNIHVGDTDEAVELIYEDTHYRYSLTSTRSGSITLDFEDGQRFLLMDALSQQKINMEDLILNGLQVIIEPKDNPMVGSFNYYPLGRWSLNEYGIFPSNHFMYMANEPGGELSAYFAVDELIELIERCGYADEAGNIREARAVWSTRYMIEGIEYVKDSHLEAWGLKADIGWAISSTRAPVRFSFV